MREGWVKCKLGDVCEKTKNFDWKSCNAKASFKYIDLSSVSRDTLSVEETSIITKTSAPSRAKKEVNFNDVIFATTRPTLKRVTIIDRSLDGQICSTGYALLRGKKEVVRPEFIYYYIQTEFFMDRMSTMQRGSSYPAVSDSDVKDSEFLLPPLQEQEQIVTLLDKAFTAIDQAKANIERNIENAKELFQSKLNEIFSQKGEGWEEKTLGELGQLTSSKRIFKKEYVSEGVPFYRSKEIKELAHGKEVSLELFITKERYEDIKRRFGIPQAGDILLTAVGTIGEMHVVKENEEFYFKDGNIMWLKGFDSLNTYYLKYALTSFVEQLKAMSRGAAYSALTIEKLKKYSVPVPSDKTQSRIVGELDTLKGITQHSIIAYNKKLSFLDELKKSLLQKAFSGELTTGDTLLEN